MLETPQKQYTCTFIDRLSNTTTTVLETPQKQYTGTFIDRLSNTTTTVLETPQKQYTGTFIDTRYHHYCVRDTTDTGTRQTF